MKNRKQHQDEYLKEVIQKISEYKWLESEKAGQDLGQKAIKDWIDRFAKSHRKEYIEKKLALAEESLTTLKNDKSIPTEIIDMLEKIYDHIGSIKDTIEVNGLKITE